MNDRVPAKASGTVPELVEGCGFRAHLRVFPVQTGISCNPAMDRGVVW